MTSGHMNSGDWGEPYVLLRLLGDGRVALTDENENEIEGSYLEILEALRFEAKDRNVRYIRDQNMGDYYTILVLVNNVPTAESRSDLFVAGATEILEAVKSRTRAPYPMSDKLVGFFGDIELTSYKAKSVDKSDIFLTPFDPRAGLVRRDVGYSIKTKWAEPATLFNCGANGNRSIYKLTGDITPELIELVHSMTVLRNGKLHADVTRRWRTLAEHGITFEFFDYAFAPGAKCRAFRESLELINPNAVVVFEQIVRQHFENGLFPSGTPMRTVCEWLVETNPCGVTRPEVKYEYILKTFLYAVHCGLSASKPWDGKSNVNGGLITVDKDGKVLAFNALDGEVFKSYLLNHTCMEYPGTDKDHGNYGVIRWDDELGCYCFDLSFTIRYSRY